MRYVVYVRLCDLVTSACAPTCMPRNKMSLIPRPSVRPPVKMVVCTILGGGGGGVWEQD